MSYKAKLSVTGHHIQRWSSHKCQITESVKSVPRENMKSPETLSKTELEYPQNPETIIISLTKYFPAGAKRLRKSKN